MHNRLTFELYMAFVIIFVKNISHMASSKKGNELDEGFKKKYNNGNYFRVKDGFTKPIASRILKFYFGDAFVSITPNHEARQFDVFVKDSVNDKQYVKFKTFWADLFNMHKSSNK